MRHGRLLRRLLVVLVVLMALGAAADVVALQVAESKAAAGFAHATAAEKATIDLGGFPFLPRLLSGHVQKIDLKATGLSGAGLRVASLEVRGEDIRFSPSGAISLIRSEHSGRTKVTAANPYGHAEIDQGDLQEFVRSRQPSVHDVSISPAGIEVHFSLEPGGPVSPPARFLPRIEDRKLILTLVGFAGVPRSLFDRAKRIEHSIDLPPIPEGVSVDVRLGQGSFTLEASGVKVDLLVGEGGVTSASAPWAHT